MAGVGDRASSSPSPVLTPDRPEEPNDREALVEEVSMGDNGTEGNAIIARHGGDNGVVMVFAPQALLTFTAGITAVPRRLVGGTLWVLLRAVAGVSRL